MASTINAKNTSTGVVITPDASGQLELQTADTTRMTINSSGNVGIGTSTPTAKLHVSGISLGNSNIRLTNTFTNGRSWELNPYASGVSDVPFTIRDVTAGADRITIDSSGNVGIGTNSPAERLHVNGGDIRIQQIIPELKFVSEGAVNRWYVGANISDSVDGGLCFGNGTGVGNNERMRIDSSGNVGIGTSSPATRLNVAGGDLRLGDNYAINWGGIGAAIIGANNSLLRFDVNGAERMRIDSSGNLLFNSGYGSVATAYGCRAWVNFNGTGTVAIRASGNVTSITDNGTGDYTVNFTNAMPNVNYTPIISIQRGDGAAINPGYGCVYATAANAYTSITTGSVRIITTNSATAALDMPFVGVSVFR